MQFSKPLLSESEPSPKRSPNYCSKPCCTVHKKKIVLSETVVHLTIVNTMFVTLIVDLIFLHIHIHIHIHIYTYIYT